MLASTVTTRRVMFLPAWTWIALLGAGMVVSGVLAWGVAATRVVLPYDEAFVGLSRAELAAANARLLAFLAHDRVTFAGTLIAVGVLYFEIARLPLRRGEAWAFWVVALSGGVGFASFLLYLGFGYFDPLHATATTILLVLFVLGMVGMLPEMARRPVPVGERRTRTHGGRAWRRWLAERERGQVGLMAVGTGLILGGASLATIGVTTVFVAEDLEFMDTSRAALDAISPRLVPLIAHDRAGLGGALVSNGILVTLTTLWAYRRGARWLWWTMLLSGVPGFVAAIGTHAAVGYVDLLHLAPALTGAGLYALALVLSYSDLVHAP